MSFELAEDPPRPVSRKQQNWAVDKLKPYAGNARTHSEAQVEQLVASIRRFGWTGPLLIHEDGTLITGHGRLLAAKKLGMKSVPVIVATGWSEDQRREYTIADNQLALNAGWDSHLLALEVGALKELEGFDGKALGFRPSQIESMLKTIDVNAAPQLSGAFAYRLVVDCADENVQATLMARLEVEGFTCRPLVS